MKFHFTEGAMTMMMIKWKIRCSALATITPRGPFSAKIRTSAQLSEKSEIKSLGEILRSCESTKMWYEHPLACPCDALQSMAQIPILSALDAWRHIFQQEMLFCQNIKARVRFVLDWQPLLSSEMCREVQIWKTLKTVLLHCSSLTMLPVHWGSYTYILQK